MLTTHEIQVAMREEILPLVEKLQERISALYVGSVDAFLGPQGLTIPMNDASFVMQRITGCQTLVRLIADQNNIPIPEWTRKGQLTKSEV